LLGLFFDPADGGDTYFRNVGRLSKDYNVVTQKIEVFITTAVRT
jgi:hypothetical protein